MNQMMSQDKVGIDNNDLNLVQQSTLSENDIVTTGRGIQPSWHYSTNSQSQSTDSNSTASSLAERLGFQFPQQNQFNNDTNSLVINQRSNDLINAAASNPMTSSLAARLGFTVMNDNVQFPQQNLYNNDSNSLPINQTNDEVIEQAAATNSSASSLAGRLGFGLIDGQITAPQLRQSEAPQSSNNLFSIGGEVRQNMNYVTYPSLNENEEIVTGSILNSSKSRGFDITKRRERNRVHAKKSRYRKKFFLESLQEEVKQLQIENTKLRMIVKEKIPNKSDSIIRECCKPNPLFTSEFVDGVGKNMKDLNHYDYKIVQTFRLSQRNFIFTDPKLEDNPIVFASEGFYTLTGYTQEEVIGKNCRFLQGPRTSKQSVDIIRVALETGTDVNVCVLNYKKDQTPFWNQLYISALRDTNDQIVNYVGLLCEVKPEDGAMVEEMVNSAMPLKPRES